MDSETQRALKVFYNLQSELQKSDDPIRLKQVNQIIAVMESSFYTKIVELNKSLNTLKQYKNLDPDDIDLDPNSGGIMVTRGDIGHSSRRKKESKANIKNRMPVSPEDFEKRVKRIVGDRELKHVQISKRTPDQTLGFSIKCNPQTKCVFVEDVSANSIASECGIKPQDQIVAVDGVPLDDPDTNRDIALQALKNNHTRIDLHIAKANPNLLGADLSPNNNQGHLRNRSDIGRIRELDTEWTQYEIIELNSLNGSFGFGITGGLSGGVMVRTILNGGSADQDGHLQINDHIMYIKDKCVRRMTNNQVAEILKSNPEEVTLIVARPFDQKSQQPNNGRVQMVETEKLDARLEMIVNRLYHDPSSFVVEEELVQTTSGRDFAYNSRRSNDYQDNESVVNELYRDESEDIFEHLEIELPQTDESFGITLASIYQEDPYHMGTIKGVFIKEVEGHSLAARCGIQKYDIIHKINGKLIDDKNMEQSIHLMMNADNNINLSLIRYTSGPTQQKLISNDNHKRQSGGSSVGNSDNENNHLVNSGGRRKKEYREYQFQNHPQPLSLDEKKTIIKQWKDIVGEDKEIVIAEFSKFTENGGLGISLEGTVDIDENGKEIHPHHYIRSIVPNGPAGKNGFLNEKDELLEANGERIYGLNHLDAVHVLKNVPMCVQIICCRSPDSPHLQRAVANNLNHEEEEVSMEEADRLCKDLDDIIAREVGFSNVTNGHIKSAGAFGGDNTLSSHSMYNMHSKSQDNLNDAWFNESNNDSEDLKSSRSRSLDQIQGLAIWDRSITYVELEKKSHGLGFSILDYQDPVNPSQSVIVVRSLVPNGAAAKDGRIFPGDRLMSVNNVDVSRANMMEAVEALKETQPGLVKLGIVKALCLDPNSNQKIVSDESKPTISQSKSIESPHLADEVDNDINLEEFVEDTIVIPSALEQNVKISKLAGQKLGLTLESEGGFSNNENGYMITMIEKDSLASKCNSLNIGDYVTRMENESLREADDFMVQDILRKTSAMSGDVKVSFIPESDYQVFVQSKNMQENFK